MSIEVRIGETLIWHFSTTNPTTGGIQDAANIPAGMLYRNGAQIGTPVVSVIRQAAGQYQLSIPFADAVWDAGDRWQVRGSATVNGISNIGDICDGRVMGYPVTAIPNAAAGAVGGVPVLDANLNVAATLGTPALHTMLNTGDVFEPGVSYGEGLRAIFCVLAGESDVATNNESVRFKRANGDIAVTVGFDALGNRTDVTLGDLD